MEKPIWIKFNVGDESHIINLESVIDIKFNGHCDFCPADIEIRYADRTYTQFKGTRENMTSLYEKIMNAMRCVCTMYDCDGAAPTAGRLPNLDQCVLISEDNEHKTVTKLNS